VFIGPSLIANLTLDIEAITATNPEEPPTGVLVFAVTLGIVLTALWIALATNSGIDDAVVTWLAPFPMLCVGREWLRGTLVGRDRAASTLPAVVAGSTVLIVVFFAGRGLGVEPVAGIALAITLGAAAETAVLGLSALGGRSARRPRPRVDHAGEPAGRS
jgi:hypothetical protein